MIDKSLGDLKVRKSYQRVVQIDPTDRNVLLDGTGSLYKVHGSAVTGSVKFAETASYALNASNITVKDGIYQDIEVDDNGTKWLIREHVVDYTRIQKVGPFKLLGNHYPNLGSLKEITLGNNLSFNGDILDVNVNSLFDGDKGDINVTNNGLNWTIKQRVVDYDKIQSVNKNKLLGRNSLTDGTIEEITLGANITMDGTRLSVSTGTATVGDGNYVDIEISGSGTIYTITSGSVLYHKIQDVSGSRILGRYDNFIGKVQEIEVGDGLVFDNSILKLDPNSITLSGDKGDIFIDPDPDGNGWEIKNNRVTLPKLQPLTEQRLLGNPKNIVSGVEEIRLSSNLRFFDGNQLDVRKDILFDGNKVDIDVSGSGSIFAIKPKVVNFDKMQDISGSRLIGRGVYSDVGRMEEILLGNGLTMEMLPDGPTLSANGGGGVIDGNYVDINVSNSGNDWVINDNAVTLNKIQKIKSGSILGGWSSNDSEPKELTLTKGLGITGTGVYSFPFAGSKGDLTVSNIQQLDHMDYSFVINPGVVDNSKLAAGINANKIGNGQISNAEFQTLDGIRTLEGTIQVQIDTKMSNSLTNGSIFIGNTSNTAQARTVTGNVTISNTGITTIQDNVIFNNHINSNANITFDKLTQIGDSGQRTLLGRHFSTRGLIQEIEVGSGFTWDGDILSVSPTTISDENKGDITVSNFGNTWTINNNAITTAKIADNTVTNAKIQGLINVSKIGGGNVDNTEFGYLDGVTGPIQTQLNGKLGTGLTNGRIFIGNGSNIATQNQVTGDVTISNTGVTTITPLVIENGDISNSANIHGSKLANSTVTLEKLQNIATNKLLGRRSALTGVVEVINIGTGLALDSATGNLNCTVSPSSDSSSPIQNYTMTTDQTWNKAAFNDVFSVHLKTGNTTSRTFQVSNTGFNQNDRVRLFVSQDSIGKIGISFGGAAGQTFPPGRGYGVEGIRSGSHWITSLLGTPHTTEDGQWKFTNTAYGYGASNFYTGSTLTFGEKSTAYGYESNANALYTTALGADTSADFNYSVALGHDSKTLRPSTIRRRANTNNAWVVNHEQITWAVTAPDNNTNYELFVAGVSNPNNRYSLPANSAASLDIKIIGMQTGTTPNNAFYEGTVHLRTDSNGIMLNPTFVGSFVLNNIGGTISFNVQNNNQLELIIRHTNPGQVNWVAKADVFETVFST